MSPENIPSPENQPTVATANSGGTRKTPNQRPQDPPQHPPLNCPRCESSNTKFCYYNNYSLTQPRYFCKTCRRYWTRGGALRSVPIGGGCRKSKKLRSSSLFCTTSLKLLSFGEHFQGDEFGSGFKFTGPNSSGTTPPMEFQLGGLSLPGLHPATAGVYSRFISSSGACKGPGAGFGLDLPSVNYPINPSTMSCATQSSIHTTTPEQPQPQPQPQRPDAISSIESLSSINQEMHWKLQQQRLAMIYGPTSQDDDTDTKIITTATNHHLQEKNHEDGAIDLFKNDNSNDHHNNSVGNRVGPTEWLFSPTNYGANHDNITTTMSMGVTTGCNDSVHEGVVSNLSGFWGHDLHQQQQVQFNGLQ